MVGPSNTAEWYTGITSSIQSVVRIHQRSRAKKCNADGCGGRLSEDGSHRFNPLPKEKRGEIANQDIVQVVSCVSRMARHLAKGKRKMTSGKVLEKNVGDVLEWVNRRRYHPQPPTQLQRCPSSSAAAAESGRRPWSGKGSRVGR